MINRRSWTSWGFVVLLSFFTCTGCGSESAPQEASWVRFDTGHGGTSLAIDFQGGVWVASAGDGSLVRHLADGSLDKEIPGAGNPRDLAIDGSGRIWFVDATRNGLSNGALRRLDDGASLVDAVTLNKAPRKVALEPDGGVWVASETTLQRFTEDGEIDSNFDLPAPPLDLAVDRSGALWLLTASGQNGSGSPLLLRLSPTGAVLMENSLTEYARRFALAPDGFVVVQDAKGRIYQYNELGSETGAYIPDPPFAQPGSAVGIAVSEEGEIVYATDTDLRVLSPELVELARYPFVDSTTNTAYLLLPRDIAIGSHGQVWLLSADPVSPASDSPENTTLLFIDEVVTGGQYFPDDTMIWPY